MLTLAIVLTLKANPIWYYGQLRCPFYCTKGWICDYIPCKDEAKAQRICAAKPCWTYRP